MNRALLTSSRPDWRTPRAVLDLVRRFAGKNGITLDPCSGPGSLVSAEFEWTERDNGLRREWCLDGLAYVNPPYGRAIQQWVIKCAQEAMLAEGHGGEIIALLPARPDTQWFQYVWDANALCFWRGRLTFEGAPSCAPFPSCIAYWGERHYRFANVFSEVGHIVLK